MTMTKMVPPSRTRVSWAPGDKTGERQKWCRDAMAYCRLKKRPSAGALVAALAPHLNAGLGYTWITNDQLLADMAGSHLSAIERAVQIADTEIGVIERQTVEIRNDAGRVIGRNRRIFPTRPEGMLDTLENHRTLKVLPNPECERKSSFSTGSSATLGVRSEVSGNSPKEEENHRPPNLDHRTPNRTPTGSGDNEDFLPHDRNVSIYPSDLPGFGEDASRLVADLSMVGPTDTDYSRLITIGRLAWKAERAGRITPTESEIVVDHIRDAARRAWLDHRPEVQKMLTALSGHASPRQEAPPAERRA